ncbi:hypothetical protein BDV96DRAFT_607717 [Lophiotrema nucula]|uniref:Uncharacterized protein n=1 Tax=Lophiotrema nucula TaxID=690887 RepID=A0A6A5YGH7_9PLEO|nr:hypothetical protein BDV96DRAFT_607717 [Lophiotrema nucula]
MGATYTLAGYLMKAIRVSRCGMIPEGSEIMPMSNVFSRLSLGRVPGSTLRLLACTHNVARPEDGFFIIPTKLALALTTIVAVTFNYQNDPTWYSVFLEVYEAYPAYAIDTFPRFREVYKRFPVDAADMSFRFPRRDEDEDTYIDWVMVDARERFASVSRGRGREMQECLGR